MPRIRRANDISVPDLSLVGLAADNLPSAARTSETASPLSQGQTYHAMLAPLPDGTVHLHPPRLLLLRRKRLDRDRDPRPAAPAVQTCVSWCEGALGEGSDLGGREESWGGEGEGAHRGEEG